jgi:hypothetical protein
VHDRAGRGAAERAAGRAGALLAGVVGAHGLVLARWPARRGLRLACFGLMLVLLGVVPAARYMDATERGNVRLAHDGGVLASDEAVGVLLEGRDPYQASYAEVLAGWRIDVEGRPAANPLADHYPYWPGSLGLLAAVEVPLRAVGRDADPRVLYLLVYLALGCGWVPGACASAGTWAWPWPSASTRCCSPTCGRG